MDDLQRDQITNRLKSWVNTRPVVRLAPSERSADFLARTFKVCNNLVQILKAVFCNGRVENTHMTSQIHLAQKWPSKYFPDFLTGKLVICPSKIGSSAVAFLYHSAIFAEMAWSGGESAFWLIEPFLQLEWCLIVPLKFRQRVAHQITGE